MNKYRSMEITAEIMYECRSLAMLRRDLECGLALKNNPAFVQWAQERIAEKEDEMRKIRWATMGLRLPW